MRQAEHPVLPLFLERWSPRSLSDEPLTREELLSLLEAARWAPSGGNQQPWRFVYALRGDDGFDRLLASLKPNNQLWAKRAAALVAVASKSTALMNGVETPSPSHAFDAGAAWMSLALHATARGWATHAMGGFERSKAEEAIALPADHALHAVVAIGRAGDPSALPEPLRAREAPSGRRPLSEIAFEGSFTSASAGPPRY